MVIWHFELFRHRLCVIFLACVSEISVESLQEGPIVVKFLLAEPDGVEGDGNFQLQEGILEYAQVDQVFVFGLGRPNDAVDEYHPGEVVIEQSAIDAALAQLLHLQPRPHICEQRVDPREDGLPRGLVRCDCLFVHVKNIGVIHLSTATSNERFTSVLYPQPSPHLQHKAYSII